MQLSGGLCTRLRQCLQYLSCRCAEQDLACSYQEASVQDSGNVCSTCHVDALSRTLHAAIRRPLYKTLVHGLREVNPEAAAMLEASPRLRNPTKRNTIDRVAMSMAKVHRSCLALLDVMWASLQSWKHNDQFTVTLLIWICQMLMSMAILSLSAAPI